MTDWPAIFAGRGFRVVECRDIITATLPTWEHFRAVYERCDGEVIRRYSERLVDRVLTHLELIPGMLAARGSFPVLCAKSPQQLKRLNRHSRRGRSRASGSHSWRCTSAHSAHRISAPHMRPGVVKAQRTK